jgi:hypothetical protein
MIRKKETLPRGAAPRIGGVTGVHIASWPADSERLEGLIRKGIGAYLNRHPELPYYMDKGSFEMKAWRGKSEEMGRFSVTLVISKRPGPGARPRGSAAV